MLFSSAVLALAFAFRSVAAQAAGYGTSCDTSATGGDATWRNAMHSEINDPTSQAHTMIQAMCNPGSTPSSKFYDCTANGNTRQNCQYSVSTLSYNMTFAMWDPTSTYTLCDTVANLINGFCISSPSNPQQGSGYYRSATENYNLELTYNLPFVSCSSSGLPSGNTAPLTSALVQNCNPGFASSCNAPNDSDDEPECDRVARNTAAFYVYLKAQNYGQGGIPNCAGVTEELVTRCVEDKNVAGGSWGIGTVTDGSQEYYELDFISDGFQDPDFFNFVNQTTGT